MKKYKNAAYDDEYIDLFIYNINKKIKEERINKGYSINQLAQAANINQAQLSKIENGYSKPSLQSLIKIMLALDMSSICLTEEYANIEYKHRFMNAVKDLKPETIESMLKLIESL